MLEFSVAKSSEFQPSDGLNLFNSAEEVQLLYHAIQETHYDHVSTARSGSEGTMDFRSRFSIPFQEVFQEHKFKVEGKKGFLTALLTSKPQLVAEAYPLHNQDTCKELSSMLKCSFIPDFRGLNLGKIRNYFGMSFIYKWVATYNIMECRILSLEHILCASQWWHYHVSRTVM